MIRSRSWPSNVNAARAGSVPRAALQIVRAGRSTQGSQLIKTPFVMLNVAGVQKVGLELRYQHW